jgi:hypothetical protein
LSAHSNARFPDPSQGVVFYVVIDDRLHRPAAIERPYGDSRLVIAHLRRMGEPDEVVRCAFPMLEPVEQAPWRRGFLIPPWPANPLDYVSADVRAIEEHIPPELRMPPEMRLP